jgi:hypothetical protein
MDEFMTREQIERQFDAEWVLIEDPQTDEFLEVHGGRVRCHSKDRDEVYRCAIELPAPKRIATLYTGKVPPPGEAILL